jgi:CRP-like cAMP-binding protein
MSTPLEQDVSNCPIFAGLSHENVEELLKKATRLYVRPCSHICDEGEPASSFFLILEGQVRYCRATTDGREILIRMLAKEEVFGLGSFVRKGLRYLGTAESIGHCDILKWHEADIRHFAEEYPRLQENALAIVLTYLGEYSQRHASLVNETAQMRLARSLIDLAQRMGKPTPHGVEVQVSNEDLGALADVSRFTTSRTVAEWSKRKLIKKKRNAISVIAPDGLVAAPSDEPPVD